MGTGTASSRGGASLLTQVSAPRSWKGEIAWVLRLVAAHLHWLALEARARVRAWRAGARVPPGTLVPFDRSLYTDQRRALSLIERHGPVFKLVSDDQWTTCVAGLGRARSLLTEHEDSLPGVTIDLTPLFPGGALRGMEGEDHKTYRRLLLQALQATPMEAHAEAIHAVVTRALDTMAEESRAGPVGGPQIRAALRDGTSDVMLRILFGVDRSSPAHGPLRQAYREFGPDAPAYALNASNRRAFARLQAIARDLAGGVIRTDTTPSMLRHLVISGQLDETVLGNLINLFESAHFDVYSLWHWMLWYLAREPELGQRLRAMPEGSADAAALLEAIVRETLRLNQSEVLLRHATTDIAFDGYFIPAGSTVRACIWESHKDATVFAEPFRFNPDRFLEQDPDIEKFAPFGVDKRRCIGGDVIFATSTAFAERLARDFEVEIAADGTPVRGNFHWEPSPEFAVRVSRRTSTSARDSSGPSIQARGHGTSPLRHPE